MNVRKSIWTLFWVLLVLCGSSAPQRVASAAPEVEITFRVTVPESTPDEAEIWVSGNVPTLGTWSGRGVLLESAGDRLFTARVAFEEGTHLEFKLTRGGWETVEKGAKGEEIRNRRHEVDSDEVLDIQVASWRDQTETPARASTLSGDIRMHESVASKHLAKQRNVVVYLPPDYDTDSSHRYPVLYMHDGQNIFDEATSFIGMEWGVDEAAEDLIAAGEIEPLIVVGVYNSSDRVHEYTQVADPDRGGGGADDYGRFLVEELKPFIDSTYRTRTDAASTGICGSSLGGLVSMYFGLERPDVFTRIGAVSPAVFWAKNQLLEVVKERGFQDGSRVWVDIGTKEGGTRAEQNRWVRSARGLRDALVNEGWVLDQDLRYVEDKGAVHNEGAWKKRIPDILRFLFPA